MGISIQIQQVEVGRFLIDLQQSLIYHAAIITQ
jgi:hypothetical protein